MHEAWQAQFLGSQTTEDVASCAVNTQHLHHSLLQ